MLHHKERIFSVKDLIDPFHEQKHPTLHHSLSLSLSLSCCCCCCWAGAGISSSRAQTLSPHNKWLWETEGEADILQIQFLVHRLTASTRNQLPHIVLLPSSVTYHWLIIVFLTTTNLFSSLTDTKNYLFTSLIWYNLCRNRMSEQSDHSTVNQSNIEKGCSIW